MINEISRIIAFVYNNIIEIWPLLILTIPLSVLIREIGVSKKINSILSKNIFLSILIATLIGAIAPFCSCSVIPIISSMLISGVPIAPIMSFWLASPSMDPEIFFLSVASLGWDLGVARIMATFIMSLSGGFITHYLIGRKIKNNDGLLKSVNSCDDNNTCSQEDEDVHKNDTKRFTKIMWMKVLNSSKDSMLLILKFLLIAYVLEAIIIFYVPSEMVLGIFGNRAYASVVRATFIGIPLYTTNLSALGMVAGLLEKGLHPGAALAFIISGATTTMPAMAAVYNLVHRKVFIIYLSITIVFAILSGFIFEMLF